MINANLIKIEIKIQKLFGIGAIVMMNELRIIIGPIVIVVEVPALTWCARKISKGINKLTRKKE